MSEQPRQLYWTYSAIKESRANESVLEHGYSVSDFCIGTVLNQEIICSCCARLSGLARTYASREGAMSWGFMVYGEYPKDIPEV